MTPWTVARQAPQSKEFSTAVGSRSLLQGVLPTQGWNPGLLHCRQILYQLNHQGSPELLTGRHHLNPEGKDSSWTHKKITRGKTSRNRHGLPGTAIIRASPALICDELFLSKKIINKPRKVSHLQSRTSSGTEPAQRFQGENPLKVNN